MRMTAEPLGLLARRYSIVADGAPVTEITFPVFGPSSATPIAGQTYRMRRSGTLRERFMLECDQDETRLVVSATQRDPMRRDFAIETNGRRLTMRAASLLRSEYQLFDGDRPIGAIRPAGALHRGAEADLPNDLPLEVRVFLVWVALLLWRGRRATRAAASE